MFAANRRSLQPIPLHVTGLSDLSVLKDALEHHTHAKVWDKWQLPLCQFSDGPMAHLFDVKNMVYLTADSPHVVVSLEPEKLYVIGGLVDRNRHKVLPQNFLVSLFPQLSLGPLSNRPQKRTLRV